VPEQQLGPVHVVKGGERRGEHMRHVGD
jgi:hypothetical protein